MHKITQEHKNKCYSKYENYSSKTFAVQKVLAVFTSLSCKNNNRMSL